MREDREEKRELSGLGKGEGRRRRRSKKRDFTFIIYNSRRSRPRLLVRRQTTQDTVNERAWLSCTAAQCITAQKMKDLSTQNSNEKTSKTGSYLLTAKHYGNNNKSSMVSKRCPSQWRGRKAKMEKKLDSPQLSSKQITPMHRFTAVMATLVTTVRWLLLSVGIQSTFNGK